ncbi:MAG: DNA polymerase III subunit delta [Solobacterium sp.]|nr:DNA polymerase III subunit delta [Solobacterium sp.]
MIYLLEGKETYQLLESRRSLIKKSNALPENILVLDASGRSQFSLEAALNMCSTVSLFSDRRVVVLDDPYFLKAAKEGTGKKKQKKIVDNAALLENYCRDPNPDTDLILFCDGFPADKRTREFKVLQKYDNAVTILSFSTPSMWQLEQKIDELLNDNKIRLTKDAREEMKKRIGGSATELYKTIDKFVLYGKKNLDRNDIEHLVSYNQDVNTWSLGDAFVAGDADGTFRALHEMLDHSNVAVQQILPQLAYRIRTLYEVVICYECGMTMEQIKNKTGRSYPDKDMIAAHGKSSRYFLKLMAQMADLDQAVKTGRIEPRNGLEMFLLRNL